jgi:hypothetical protein
MRFGHQSYHAIEAFAARPEYGIKLTNRERTNCMTCAEGKKTKKDSDQLSPIDMVGGVICSVLKGSITTVATRVQIPR